MAATATERKLLIGGEWVETGDWHEVRSPYSGEVVGRVAKAGANEARAAIDAAEQAMADPLPAHKRAEILVRVVAGIARRHDEIAAQIAAEAGKPLKTAKVEASRAMSTYTFAAVEARKLAGEVVPMDAAQAGEGKLAFTLREPIGIVGAISPFNFPLNLVAHKIAPALAAGCAVVLKPAGQTPLSALTLAELEHEAGLPPGWLNVLVGPASEIGDVLVDDERVKAITFTGSSEIGWGLRERAARKKVLLELGNATPVIVHGDADLDEATTKLAANAFSFAGQSCISVQRIYVQKRLYDDFVAGFVPKVEQLVVGDPADAETDVGPVIDEGARERILSWIEEARDGGRRGALRRGPRRRPDQADGDRERGSRPEGLPRGGVRPGLRRQLVRVARRGDRARQRHALRPAGGDLHRRHPRRAAGAAASSSSAASPSTRRPRSAPTRCPTGASRTRATRARDRPTRCTS